MLINVAIVRLLSLLYRIPLPDSTAIYSSLLLTDTYFLCFVFMNNAALSFILHIFIAPVQGVFALFLTDPFLDLPLLCSVSQRPDPHRLHFPDSCAPGWLLNWANGRHWPGEGGEKSWCLSSSLSDGVTPASPAPIAHLVLASAQRLQLTPGLL